MSDSLHSAVVVHPRLVIPATELEWSFARSSGPGGQHVNKVSSKAILRWNPALSSALPDVVRERFLTRYAARLTTAGDLIITSEESRDRLRNIERCQSKLRELVQSVLRPQRRRVPTQPTRAARQRQRVAKQLRSLKKQQRRRIRLDES